MFCERCGKKLSEKHVFCDNCGTPVAKVPVSPTPVSPMSVSPIPASPMSLRKFHCPHCGSEDLFPITSTETSITSSGGGFSAGKGCLGYFLLDPLGLLCGACGSKVKTDVQNSTKNYWACRSCGKKFLDIDTLAALLEQEKANLNSLTARFGFSLVFSLIWGIAMLMHLKEASDAMLPMYIIFLLILFILPFIALARKNAGKQRCEELEREKAFLEQYAYGGQNVAR